MFFFKRKLVATIVLMSVATMPLTYDVYGATRTHVVHTSRLSTQGRYVVVGRVLSANVARAVVELLKCQAINGKDYGACKSEHQADTVAESALLKRGQEVLNLAEPVSSDPIYGAIPVVVYLRQTSSAVVTELPASLVREDINVVQNVDGNLDSSRRDAAENHSIRPQVSPRDSGQLPTTWNGCDGTWCYGHVQIYSSPTSQGWSLIFGFYVKFSQNCYNGPGQTLWGSGWAVSGSGVQATWSNLGYRNSANASHNTEWPIGYGTVAFSAPGNPNPLTEYAEIDVSMDCAGDLWRWNGFAHIV